MQMQIAASHVARLFSEGVEADPPKTRAAQMRQRAERFRETLGQRLTRNILGLAYALQPGRLADVPALIAFVSRARLAGQSHSHE